MWPQQRFPSRGTHDVDGRCTDEGGAEDGAGGDFRVDTETVDIPPVLGLSGSQPNNGQKWFVPIYYYVVSSREKKNSFIESRRLFATERKLTPPPACPPEIYRDNDYMLQGTTNPRPEMSSSYYLSFRSLAKEYRDTLMCRTDTLVSERQRICAATHLKPGAAL